MARAKPTDGYARRIALALESGPNPMSVRKLADELGGDHGRFRDLRGTSYGGVRQYVEGKVRNPRVELLRAIAAVLEVRPDWLAFNHGAMTEEEERVRADHAGMSAVQDTGHVLWSRAFEMKREYLQGLLAVDGADLTARQGRRITEIPHWVATVSEVAQRLQVDVGQLGSALRAYLAGLGIDATRMPDDAIDDLVMTTTPALAALSAERARQAAAHPEPHAED